MNLEKPFDDLVLLNFKDCKKYPNEGPITIKTSIISITKSLNENENLCFAIS